MALYTKINGVWKGVGNSWTPTLSFNANGGTGTMPVYRGFGKFVIPDLGFTRSGFRFLGWNTAPDGSGREYQSGQEIELTNDLILYAQWIQLFTVTYRHSETSDWHGSSDTGPMEYYALYIDGVEQSDLGAFSNSARTYTLPYGTTIKVYVGDKYGDSKSYVTLNGTTVAGSGNSAEYSMTLASNLDIHMVWNTTGLALINPGSFWRCHLTTS